jgi:hypothetical protein
MKIWLMTFQASNSVRNKIVGITIGKELNMQNSRLIEGMGIVHRDESMWSERREVITLLDYQPIIGGKEQSCRVAR